MKAHEAPTSFRVPLTLGRTASDLVAREDQAEQLDLFREFMDPATRLQLLAMFALSDAKRIADIQHARVADIAEVMGYERTRRGVFDPKLYERIKDCFVMLQQKQTPMLFRTPTRRKDTKGRTVYATDVAFITILQEFGFRYEDDDGQTIDLNKADDRIPYHRDPVGRYPIWVLPLTDEHGRVVTDESGNPRLRPASGIFWRFTSRLAEMSQQKGTSWIFYREAVEILRKYLTKPATFELIWQTLFWKGQGQIEIQYDKLVRHLNIQSKDRKQTRATIDRAFQALLDEGIIDARPTIDPAGKWINGQKKPRRTSETIRWRRSSKWTIPSMLPAGHQDDAAMVDAEEVADADI